jgi:hypothetical protein
MLLFLIGTIFLCAEAAKERAVGTPLPYQVDEISGRVKWFHGYDGSDTWNGVTIPASGRSLQYHNSVTPYLRGTESTAINWGDILGSTFTMCTLARYSAAGGSMGRMFTGGNQNWLHGFHDKRTQVCHYTHGWNTPHNQDSSREWRIMCGQNGGSFIFRTNGKVDRRVANHAGKPNWVGTNVGQQGNEKSAFDIMEIITFNRALNSDEINTIIDYFEERLLYGVDASQVNAISGRKKWFRDYTGTDTWNGVSIPTSGRSLQMNNDLMPYLRGTESTAINWGDILGSTFTMCTLARYSAAGGSMGRMFTGGNQNWLHGFHDKRTQVCHYTGGWNTPHNQDHSRHWRIMCGQNGGSFIFRTNGKVDRRVANHAGKPNWVGTNVGQQGNEKSAFDIMEIITFTRALNSDEVNTIIDYFQAKLDFSAIQTYTFYGDGVCPDNQHVGRASADFPSPQACRERCDTNHLESYFSLYEDRGDIMCSCYDDCDSFEPGVQGRTYEIMSSTMQDVVQNLKVEIDQRDTSIETLTGEKAQCEEDLEDSNELKTLYKNRFDKVVELENSDKHHISDKAIAAFPAQTAVGASLVECKPKSMPNAVDRLMFFLLGLSASAFFFSVMKKKEGDSYSALMEL